VERQIVIAMGILLVEDEPLIAELLREALEDGGFAVELAYTGEQAISLLQAPASAYTALVADVGLRAGGLTGWQVARCAREINPELAVIYITASHPEHWPSERVPNSIVIAKPFAAEQVLTALSQLLKAEASSGHSVVATPARLNHPARSCGAGITRPSR
jgi:DNA-binding response OmpR family regulator